MTPATVSEAAEALQMLDEAARILRRADLVVFAQALVAYLDASDGYPMVPPGPYLAFLRQLRQAGAERPTLRR